MKKVFLIILILPACKEAYDPPVVSGNHAYLVVEGFINNGTDSTLFTLSRTYKIYDTRQTAPPELNAQVSVQGNDNSSYPLTELGNGSYGAASLSLNPAQLYRLMIVTADGNQYQSDYVPLKTSPPIDSINWKNSDNGLRIYANTHDPQNASHYYRWTYSETWEFHSIYFSEMEYTNDSLQTRPNPDTIFYCWQGDYSQRILLGNSTKLAQDDIFEAPLVLVPPFSWKIGFKYSILVKQYVLTPDAYTFWLNLQTNTEQIGSIFSPEPSAAKGNLHCITDSTQPVIGFVSAGTVGQQRIFITPDQIPGWTAETYQNNCAVRTTPTNADSERIYFSSQQDIPLYFTPHTISGTYVDYSTSFCVNCTTIGTNVKPSFWP